MAARLIALYQQPEDPAAFDAHYRDAHTPIILRYPGLRELRTTKVEPDRSALDAVLPAGRDGV